VEQVTEWLIQWKFHFIHPLQQHQQQLSSYALNHDSKKQKQNKNQKKNSNNNNNNNKKKKKKKQQKRNDSGVHDLYHSDEHLFELVSDRQTEQEEHHHTTLEASHKNNEEQDSHCGTTNDVTSHGEYYMECRLRFPSFFYNSSSDNRSKKNQSDSDSDEPNSTTKQREQQYQYQYIQEKLNAMLQYALHKVFIESPTKEYPHFSSLCTGPFYQYPESLEEKLLNEMYSDMGGWDQVNNFQKGTYPIEAVLDDVNSVVYLGSLSRGANDAAPDTDHHSASMGFKNHTNTNTSQWKKYGVVTAYFCCEPVMVDFDRIVFPYHKIDQIEPDYYVVYWKNREITFEMDMNSDYLSSIKSGGGEGESGNDEEDHAFQAHIESIRIGCSDEERQVLNLVLQYMDDTHMKVFYRLPKSSQLFQREKDIIKQFLHRFKSKVNIHYIIYVLSLLFGRLPDVLENYLIEIDEYETYSTTVVYLNLDEEIDENQLEDIHNDLKSQLDTIKDKLCSHYGCGRREVNKEKRKLFDDRLQQWRDIKKQLYEVATSHVNTVINGEHKLTTLADGQQFYYRYDDISRGIAKYPVAAVNHLDCSVFDSHFFMSEMKIHEEVKAEIQELYKEERHSCNCTDDCSNCPCRMRGEFGQLFDKNNRLRQIPQGRISLYECNSSCGCSKKCKNRLIQRGLQKRLELYRTENRGWGVRTLELIAAGEFVDEYVGEIISDREAENRGAKYDMVLGCSYLFDLGKSNTYSIDALHYCNTSRWFNHSCSPNLVSVDVYAEVQNECLPRVAFFAKKDIQVNEELTFDYGYTIQNRMKCRCGSPACIGWLM